MADLDEKLQEYIDEVERGAPLDSVLNKIPATNNELAQLVHLAASVRSMNHPQPDKEHHSYQLEKILRASREIPTRPVWPTRAPSRSRKVNHGWRGHWAVYPSITGIAILILFIAVTFAGAGVWLSGPPSSHYATIINVSGNVTVAANPNNGNWQQVTSGEKAYSSAVLRTGDNSKATLIFFDGTRMDIGPDAELALTGIHGGWGNILSVQLDQKGGYTSYNVVPLHGNNSKFIVNTPSGTASVRGTHFTVDVSKNGQARFAVTTGKVIVTNADSQVSVGAGQATASQPGSVPEAAAYQFNVQGPLSIIQNRQWVVSGVIFSVNKQTLMEDNAKIGEELAVAGRILPDGSWVADSVMPSVQNQPGSTFMGTIDSMDGNSWVISGVKVQVNDQTYLSEGLKLKDAVQVTFITQTDGSRLALRIESLQATHDPAANPKLIFQPANLLASDCASDYSVSGNLINQGETSGDKAANVDLGYAILQGAENIDRVTISPSSWDVINAGEQVTYTVQVNMNQGSSPLPAGSEVKIRIFVSQESNQPDKLKSSAVLILTSTCRAKPTATSTATIPPTATVTSTPVLTSTEEVNPSPGLPEMNPNSNCLQGTLQPEGLRLQQDFGASYQEIMGWFCQGYGFGEIALAYQLNADTGMSVTTIFEYRSQGMGWGNIRKLAENINTNHSVNKRHGKKPTRH